MSKAERIIAWVAALVTVITFLLDPRLSYLSWGKYIPYVTAGFWGVLSVIIWRATFSVGASNAWKYVLLAYILITVIFAGWAGYREKALSARDIMSLPISTQVSYMAWSALNESEYDLAWSISSSCYYRFEKEAMRQQLDLETMQRPPYPVGTISNANIIKEINQNRILNDFASCMWIRAHAEAKLGQIESAVSEYNQLGKFTYARVIDPDGDTYWSPAALVNDEIDSLVGP